MDDYRTEFVVAAAPEKVLAAINDVRGWWTGEIDGVSDQVGVEFTYRNRELHFEAHRKPLRRHCYRMLGGLADAEDAVQETFLRAWRGFDGYAGGSLHAWLTRIATRACLDALDRRASERRWLPDALDPDAKA